MFYPTLEESFSILVPYFATGLDKNELCFWVVPNRNVLNKCKEALRARCPDLEKRIASGQIEIVAPEDWYLRGGAFNADEVLNGWTVKVNKALSMGFDGMRIAGDTSWLHPNQHESFMDYERRVGDLFEDAKGMAICCYRLDLCSSADVIDVVSTHHLTIIKERDEWQLIVNAERKRAIEAVEALEEKRRRTEENLPVVLYSTLPDDKMTTAMITNKVGDLTGYSPEELMERPELFFEMVHPDDRAMVAKEARQQRKNKSPLKLEYRIVTKSGEVKWIKDESLPVLDEHGELVRIDGFMDDFTDLKSAEEALRISEERYALAHRSAKIGSWDWDILTGKLVWSGEIEPMFGFKTGEFGGSYEAFLKSVHPDDRKFLEDSVAACIEKGDRYDIEHRVVWPDGSVHWMSEAGDVIRDQNGKAVRMLGVVRDVTARKNYEESIRRLNTELEASNKELEAFCYSVSHDLRAPLRRIDGFSQLLLEDAGGKLDGKALAHLERIRSSTRNMDQLIEDLLRLSRITTAGISKERVDLTGIARSAAQRLAKTDATRDVKFNIKKTPPVNGDRRLLEIAIQNLMENAWKFTGKKQDPEVEFGATVENGRTVYYVKDNGVGFDEGGAAGLFQPFQRLKSANGFPGSGIGLAIVERVILRHQGKIWAEGRPDQGASFYFTLRDDSGQ